MLKIVADENMPLVEALFGEFGSIKRLAGRSISQSDLIDTDILLVRSITQVNQALLEGTKVRFVGTATIGTDHIDKDYLNQRSIAFADAAGCNAQAVAEYVLTAIAYWAEKRNIALDGITVGIIGAGNVGTRLAKVLEMVGIKCLLNDPLLESSGDRRSFVDLAQIQQCEVVTCHVPITRAGQHPTHHLIDHPFLSAMKDKSLVINSARGAVLDNQAAIDAKQQGKAIDYILDVWELEPKVNPQLLAQSLIGTPHIAGYSQQGKILGSYILYQALCQHLGKPCQQNLEELLPNSPKWTVTTDKASLYQSLKPYYDIQQDDKALRSVTVNMEAEFDKLRKNYKTRLEFM